MGHGAALFQGFKDDNAGYDKEELHRIIAVRVGRVCGDIIIVAIPPIKVVTEDDRARQTPARRQCLKFELGMTVPLLVSEVLFPKCSIC
jgi:hypothetical protein